jgi:hypothetical protein
MLVVIRYINLPRQVQLHSKQIGEKIMAHFAELGENNVVLQVIVVSDNDAPSEEAGANFCRNLLGGTWKQTSYNTAGGQHKLGGTPFRKNYAGIGFTYDSTKDAFIPPKPYASWILNEDTCLWESPVPYPTDDKPYTWDEETVNWKEVVIPE